MTSLPQVLTGDFTIVSIEAPDLSQCDKKQIRDYFMNAYNVNESLFACLTSEDGFYKSPDSLRLPLIFYYGHTAAVYVNKMILANLIQTEERVNFLFETIFETGVDEMSWDDVECDRMGSKYIWPPVYEVIQFRKKVKDLILRVIERTTLQLPINFESPWWALMMGIEHERIHIETSSVLIRQMPISLVKRPNIWKYGPTGGKHVNNELVKVCGATVTLGKPVHHPTYGWDNEYGSITMRFSDFETSKYLVSNGEFLEFVNAGGYKQKHFWSSEGWSWLTFQQANHPTFWVCNKNCKSRCGGDLNQYSHCGLSNNDTFKLRCIFDIIEMPLDWPVEVNYYEAKAFCAWKGREYRLLAEAEHVALRNQNDPNAVANIQFLYGSSTPVDFFPPNKLGLHDVNGNVWCWLEDHFNGFPGFKTNYLYDDFSMPCFDGLHTMIAGGSWATNGVHAQRFSRFSFRKHFFQHTGFRLVKQKLDKAVKLPIKLVKATDISITVDYPFVEQELNDSCIQQDSENLQFLLETRENLERTLADDEPNGLNDFILEKCLKVIERHFVPNETLLHVGCGTGGLTFGMKKYFKKVVGIDLFRSNIEICLKKCRAKERSKPEINFKQMTWIPNELSNQDVVIFSMAERVANLKAWSRRMPEVVGQSGILFNISRDGTRQLFENDEVSMNKFVLIEDSSLEFENQTIRFSAWLK